MAGEPPECPAEAPDKPLRSAVRSSGCPLVLSDLRRDDLGEVTPSRCLEDETGLLNFVVYPALFRRERTLLVTELFLLVEGVLQREGGVTSMARSVRTLRRGLTGVPSHDFH